LDLVEIGRALARSVDTWGVIADFLMHFSVAALHHTIRAAFK
jgi:hypothetical protein